jgi:hypothetical protein
VFCLGLVVVAVWMRVQVLASSESRGVSAHAAKATRRQVCLQKREPMVPFTPQAQDIVRVVGASPLCAVIATLCVRDHARSDK